MKSKRKLTTVIVALLTLTGLWPAASTAETIIEERFDQNRALAYFSFSEGCVHSVVDVTVIFSTTEPAVGAELNIVQTDECTGAFLGIGHGILASFSNASGDIKSATLDGTFTVFFTPSGTSRDVSVSLTWIGEGHFTRDVTVTEQSTSTILTRFASRAATATGSIAGIAVESDIGARLFETHAIFKTHY